MMTKNHTTVHDAAQQPDSSTGEFPLSAFQRSRTAQVVSVPTGEGPPIVGLSYATDFKTEEEMGVGELRAAMLAGADPASWLARQASDPRSAASLIPPGRPSPTQADLVHTSGDFVAFCATASHSAYSGVRLARSFDQAVEYITHAERDAQGYSSSIALAAERVPQLRARLAAVGVTPPAKAKRADLLAMVEEHATPVTPEVHAGWFHYGDMLVLRKDNTAYGRVINNLALAAQAGTLLVGGIGQVVFGSGLTLFDSRDLPRATREAVETTGRLHREHMAALQPVKTTLRARGYFWFALGNPTIRPGGDGAVRYWLNGSTTGLPPGSTQPCGWYTLEELLAEKWISAAAPKKPQAAKT